MNEPQQPLVVQGNVPAFLMKLWKIVQDPQYQHLIAWDKGGKTIRIFDQNEFSKQILPRYYKHNNISSFVRQINMYGFRKIVDSVSGGLKGESNHQWEFFHPHFQQGRPDQLHLIKRKVNLKDDMKGSSPQLSHLLQDIQKLKSQHETVDERLSLVKAENELLWREVSDLRDQHTKQQAVISKLIQFFVKLIMGKPADMTRKRRRALNYHDAMDPKMSKMSQDVLLYNPQATPSYDTNYIVESPKDERARLIELPPDTVVLETPSPAMNEESLDFDSILGNPSDNHTQIDSTEENMTSPVYGYQPVLKEQTPLQSGVLKENIISPAGVLNIATSAVNTSQQTPVVITNTLKGRNNPQTTPHSSTLHASKGIPTITQSYLPTSIIPSIPSNAVKSAIPTTNISLPVRTTVTIIPSSRRTRAKADTPKKVRLTPSKPINLTQPVNVEPTHFVSNSINASNISNQPIYVAVPSVNKQPTVTTVASTTAANTTPLLFPAMFSNKPKTVTVKTEPLTTPVNLIPVVSNENTISLSDIVPETCDSFNASSPNLLSSLQNMSETAPTNLPIVVTDESSMLAPAIPTYQRQVSFRDRNEINSDVDRISKSIDLLQEMLNKQQINLDLKNLDLNQVVQDGSSSVSIQDLIRLTQQQEELRKEEENESENQLIPYIEPFSPSQLITTHYETNPQSSSDEKQLFNEVLSNDDINLDALLQQ